MIVSCCVVVCCAVLCFVPIKKYKRISFSSDTLGENLERYVGTNTSVINTSKQTFASTLPIWSIKERNISEKAYEEMLENLGLTDNPYFVTREGNFLHYSLASYVDYSRGYFDMTDEELEKLAWETFRKIPFMDGEYEYLGIQNTMKLNDKEGDHITRAGVSFRRLLDGVRVVGEDNCVLYFDGSGLVEILIRRYDYIKTGVMKLVPLEDAAGRIKSPDDFEIEVNTEEKNIADVLQVDRVKLLLVNQESNGCTILQPLYNFIGTATLGDGTQTQFSSRIIAIPESYTYDEKK